MMLPMDAGGRLGWDLEGEDVSLGLSQPVIAKTPSVNPPERSLILVECGAAIFNLSRLSSP